MARAIPGLVSEPSQLHVKPTFHFAIQLRVGIRDRLVQVSAAADDGVELLRKVHWRLEHAPMDLEAAGPLMSKADLDGLKGVAHQHPHRPDPDTN
ncbi:hypothetical protein D9M69_561730 [compost metagenome]